jgi:hypothetical protein
MAGAATVAALAALVVPFGGAAFAAPVVTMAAGPYTSGQTITVSGTGFPTRSADPSGLSLIECTDTGGLPGNLPTDDSFCDASTANPLPVLTNSSGAFSTTYTLESLSVSGGSSIDCDQTHDCVLWVGVDYVNNFNSNDAFSGPFTISAPIASTPESPAAIALPVGAALIIGGAVFVTRRRRRTSLLT